MGTVVGHEACPRCRKEGHDRTGDNLARYADGGAYCFNCGYCIHSNGLSTLGKATQEVSKALALPGDSSRELPDVAQQYLKKYQLTDHDIKLNGIMWSESSRRIIFPILISGVLEGWIGRAVDPEVLPKVYTRGKLHDIHYILGNLAGNRIVIVEDIISAIRIGGTWEYAAMPLFGSHISTRKMLVMGRYFKEVVMWLDKDKEKESIKFSQKMRDFGINARTVISDNDPKEYSDSEILSYLTQ